MLQVVGTSGANFGQRGTGFSYQQKIGGALGFFAAPRVPVHAFGEMKKMRDEARALMRH
jgi:hypothetical protein